MTSEETRVNSEAVARILERIDELEAENRTLRSRVERLEARERHREVVRRGRDSVEIDGGRYE